MELEQNFLICSDLLFKNFQIEIFFWKFKEVTYVFTVIVIC